MFERKTIRGSVSSDIGFYIGDICYVLSNEVYDHFWGKEHGYHDGVFTVPESGRKFAVGGTAYGDGVYSDKKGHSYFVDAGVIGLVPLELVRENSDIGLGHVVSCPGKAVFEAEEGIFTIKLPNREIYTIDTY